MISEHKKRINQPRSPRPSLEGRKCSLQPDLHAQSTKGSASVVTFVHHRLSLRQALLFPRPASLWVMVHNHGLFQRLCHRSQSGDASQTRRGKTSSTQVAKGPNQRWGCKRSGGDRWERTVIDSGPIKGCWLLAGWGDGLHADGSISTTYVLRASDIVLSSFQSFTTYWTVCVEA